MTLAKRAGRSFGAVFFGSFALMASAASCTSGEPTLAPGDGASAGKTASGAGQSHGGATSGGAGLHGGGQVGSGGTVANSGGSSGGGSGATGGFAAVGGTGTAGMNTAGLSSTGGSFGTGGSAGSRASSGTGGSAGSFTPGGGRGGGAGATSSGGGAGRGSGGGGGMSGTSGSGGSGAGGNVAPPPDISGGSNGWASRYWDCCKPACGWTGNTGGRNPIKSCSQSNQTLSDNNAKNACEGGGSAFMCWQDAPWTVGDKLAYGFAAASGGNYVCGRCYHLQFNGSSHNGSGTSTQALNGKHMIVQVINNGGVAADQFDLLIPGGGVGALNACNTQWGTADLGAQYGGFLAGCNGDVNCVKQKCQTVFSGKQDLLDGCNWFLGWFGAADNPNFTFKQIACPSDITNKSGLSDPG
ncbi:MAG TPA: hypothetical protein VLJ38_12805 [Polyangiaceae bacterium]|nr:hypothetical protein [Polyangiaceae bacterium]